MRETENYGFERVRQEQLEVGLRVRALLTGKGFKSVAAEGFQAPGVVVSYTDDPEIQSGRKFVAIGVQTAAGVPLQCDEPADFTTFPHRPVRPRKTAQSRPHGAQPRRCAR
jgi:aspartate aminotransferase-like enzyme